MKHKKTSADIARELEHAKNELMIFESDDKHYSISPRGHIGGGMYIGGYRSLRPEFSVWHNALKERVDNLKTLHGMYIFSEMESKRPSNGENYE